MQASYRSEQKPSERESARDQQSSLSVPNTSFFDLKIGGPGSAQLWQSISESQLAEMGEIICQGRLFQKNSRSKKWESRHYQLHASRLVRNLAVEETQEGAQPGASVQPADFAQQEEEQKEQKTSQTQQSYEMLNLASLHMKKIKYSDQIVCTYRFGLRFQSGDVKIELFMDSQESFAKWHESIKRHSLFLKFEKKYKVMTKVPPQESWIRNGQSTLYCAFRYTDQVQFYVSVTDRLTLTEQQKQTLLREVEVLRRLSHPALQRLFEVYEDDNIVILVYEVLGSRNLLQRIRDPQFNEEQYVCDLIWRLLHGLQHLHRHGVVHGDIKLENICFKYSNQLSEVVLVDFSNSIFFQSQSQSNGPLAPQQRKLIGTSGYIAPEVFKGQKITDKVDIFSLGIILYILLYGVSPWQSKDEQSLTAENERCEIVFEAAKSRCGKLSLNSLDCLQKMLEKDPQKRYSANELLNHTWFVSMRSKVQAAARAANGRGNHSQGNQAETLYTVQEKSSDGGDTYSDNTQSGNQSVGVLVKESSQISIHNKGFMGSSLIQQPFKSQKSNSIGSGGQASNDQEEIPQDSLQSKISQLNSQNFKMAPSKRSHDKTGNN